MSRISSYMSPSGVNTTNLSGSITHSNNLSYNRSGSPHKSQQHANQGIHQKGQRGLQCSPVSVAGSKQLRRITVHRISRGFREIQQQYVNTLPTTSKDKKLISTTNSQARSLAQTLADDAEKDVTDPERRIVHSFDSSFTNSLQSAPHQIQTNNSSGPPLTARVDGITDANTTSNLEPSYQHKSRYTW